MTHTQHSPGGGARRPAGQPPRSVPPQQFLLGRAPLLRSESAEAYDELTARCAGAIDPQDMIEWLMVRDYVDLTWEILRLRRMKPHVLTVALPDAVSYIAGELAERGERDVIGAAAARDWTKGGATQQRLRRDLARHDVTDDTIETHAFLREFDSIDSLERLLADKDGMRRAVLRDLASYRSGSLARRPIVGEEVDAAVEDVAPAGPRLVTS